MAEAIVVLKKHLEASGNRPHKFIDGNDVDYVTFKDEIAGELKKHLNKPLVLQVTEGTKGKYTNRYIDAFEFPKPEENGENGDYRDKLGTGEYKTGQKPTIEARRMAGLNAANNAAAYVELEVRSLTGRNVTPAMLDEMREKWTKAIFLDNLRMGKAMEDEDIPFG